MPSQSFRIGVASVSLSLNDTTAVPSLTTLVYTASTIAATDLVINDVKSALSTADTYQVMLALVGRDTTNGGYTIAGASPGTGNLIPTTNNNIIAINVPSANWPANFDKAICAAIFLKTNSGSWQLAEFAYVSPTTDFNHSIVAKPLLNAPLFSATTLQNPATTDAILGARSPLGVTYASLSPTTGGVTVNREVSSVSVDPDTGAQISFATTRTASISFQLLSNDVKNIVQGNAGNFVSYTNGGRVIKEAQMSLNTAQALIPGNRPFKLTMPVDNLGKQEVRLYIGNLTQNQNANTEAWTKSAPTPIAYSFVPASIDALLNDQHTELIYKDLT